MSPKCEGTGNQLLSLQSDRAWPGNTGAVLEGIASLLWNTGLGTRGETCVCRNGHGAIGCHILLVEGESSLASDCLGLPMEFREVTALSSVPVLWWVHQNWRELLWLFLGQIPVAFSAEMPFESLVVGSTWSQRLKILPEMSVWRSGRSCFGTGVGRGWQEEPHSDNRFISE